MAGTSCPPHHWDIGAAGRMETWVCVQCGETKVIDRHAKDQEKLPFTIGGAKPKAEPTDPAQGMERLG